MMNADIDHKLGAFQLTAQDGVNHVTFSAYMCNNFWYHYQFSPTSSLTPTNDTSYATVKLVTD